MTRNTVGRVCAESGDAHEGEYVVGWIKRGPSGVIGTNKKDSADTTVKIGEDRDAGRLNTPTVTDPEEIAAFYAERAPDSVTWAGWEAIDAHEKTSGEPHGRPRVKLVRLADLVERSRATSAREPSPRGAGRRSGAGRRRQRRVHLGDRAQQPGVDVLGEGVDED